MRDPTMCSVCAAYVQRMCSVCAAYVTLSFPQNQLQQISPSKAGPQPQQITPISLGDGKFFIPSQVQLFTFSLNKTN